MSKVLVVYATKSGSVTEIAGRIGETLAAKGATVDVVRAEEAPDASGYDAVVVGSAVRGGTWHEPARTWLAKNAGLLAEKPVALFTVGLMITNEGKTEEVRGYTDKLIEETGVTPVGIGLFAGWNEPKAMSFIERGIMKMMKAPVGDFRDLDEVATWAEQIEPALLEA